MTAQAGGTPDATDNDDLDWRAALVPRLGALAIALIGGVGIAVLAGFRGEGTRGLGVGMLVSAALLAYLIYSRRVPTVLKASIVVASMGTAGIVGYYYAGFLPGSALAVTITLVFAALLIGRKTFIVILLGFGLFIALLTVGVASGAWIPVDPKGLDPTDATNWVRTGLISMLVWTSIGFSITFVIDTIERNLVRRREAVRTLQAEIAERRAAELARREAEFVASNAQKMEAVGQLAASIAHDFNNALLVIRGWNELRGLSDDDDREREATRAIEQATEHSAQLGRQLLTFARKDVRAPKYLSLRKLVDDLAVSLGNLVGPQITVEVDRLRDTVVFADESQLQQLIYNLVLNARDALTAGGNIRITIDAAGAESDDTQTSRWALLSVEDDGPGIEPELLETIFEPFFTTKEVGKGTGLGLATVKSIARQTGGDIDVVSQPGKTVFTLRLPGADASEEMPVAELSPRAPRELGLRILVIEDEPQARKIIAAALIRNGNEVVECDRGDKAMELLAKDREPFDLLCSDAMFPGDPLADVLAAFERHSPDGKVLICSGYVQEEIALGKLETGEYAYLAKPFDSAGLIATIRDIVGATQD